MENFYKALSAQRVWDYHRSSNTTVVDVTELWLNNSTAEVRIQHSAISVSSLSAWLRDGQVKFMDGAAFTNTLRIIWAEHNNETMQMNLSEEAFSIILDAFDLKLANQYYASHFAGVSELPSKLLRSAAIEQRYFTFSYHPKLAVLWSHVSRKPPSMIECSVNVIVLSSASKIIAIKALLDIEWEATITLHPMFPLLLCSFLLGQEVHKTQNSIKADVREVEVRTGYHHFVSRRERPAIGELGELSGRMSGCETKLASVTRKLKTLEELCGFMNKYLHPGPYLRMGDGSIERINTERLDMHGIEILHRSVGLLEGRLRMQTVDNEFILQRVRVQINALFSIITQYDNLMNLRTAQNSQLSAKLNQNDSASMKVLSIMAIIFLPGTFVSSIFSIGFFDWDSSASSGPLSVSVKPGFGLYWIVVIPLTVVVLFFYALWLLYYRMQQKNLSKDMKWDISQPTILEEVKVLSMRRETLYKK